MRPRHLHYLLAMFLQVHAIIRNETIKGLENMVGPEAFSIVGGAALDKGGGTGTSDILEGFALCARFKLKILGAQPFDLRGMVLSIGEKKFKSEKFLDFGVRHPLSWLTVGRVGGRNSSNFDSYLIQDKSGSYEVIVAHEWQHMCYSYNVSRYSHGPGE